MPSATSACCLIAPRWPKSSRLGRAFSRVTAKRDSCDTTSSATCRLKAQALEGEVLILGRARGAGRGRDQLEVVHHDEAELAERVEARRERLEVRGSERENRERQPAQPHGGPAHPGARLVAQLGGAQLVHRDP